MEKIEIVDMLPQLAERISTYYKALIHAGVPDELARDLTRDLHADMVRR